MSWSDRSQETGAPGGLRRTLHAAAYIALLCAARGLLAQTSLPAEAAARMTPARARAHIYTLASDRMLGRDTPSPELDSAADYIIACFRRYGVEPVNGSYANQYNLIQQDLGSPNVLAIGGRLFALKTQFVPLEFSSSGHVSAEAVFVAYGLSRPDSAYDNYAGIDVRGRIAVAFEGEPEDRGGLFMRAREKMRTAAGHGAVGLILLPNPARSMSMKVNGFPWPALYGGSGLPQSWRLELPSDSNAIPCISADGSVMQALLGSAAEGDSLVPFMASLDAGSAGAIGRTLGMVDLRTSIDCRRRTVRNVVGMVRGATLPDEYVVIGAHYDHIGHGRHGDIAGRSLRDTIFNGADDNASGTAAMLLAAEAFASLRNDQRPARSLLFIAFSGEEKGLFGSRAYVERPSVPNRDIAAMINLDMVGRNRPNRLSVAGTTRSTLLDEMLAQANRDEPMDLVFDLERMFPRSDQASFAARGVPALFFSSGLHPDYHRPSDEPGKINVAKVAHVARLAARTAWIIAERPERPRTVDAGGEHLPQE
ncbi:MAG TPA: M28 family peptidase [Candidatus Kapabacteria bacterium]|nr:M28 family peptidase [Candidatus Kapabacteria bacterium]